MRIDSALWARIRHHFDALVELSPDEREARLRDLEIPAGDREALHHLLAAEAGDEVLERSAPELLSIHPDEPPRDVASRDWEGCEIGPWRVDGLVSRGGMGAVYAGYRNDGRFEKKVAIKVLDAAGLDSAEHHRLAEEVRILARLEHPGIAHLIDSGVAEDGHTWLAMEFVDGLPLDEYCRTRGLGLRARIGLLCQAAEALEYAHRHQIVHCDVKPANILVTATGRVRLVDFGIARLVHDRAGMDREQRVYCSPGFTAPERLRGAAPTTVQDVYALGALLYLLITGRKIAPPGIAGPAAHGEDTIPAGGLQRGGLSRGTASPPFPVDRDLEAICRRALAVDPERRYRSVESLREDLENWLESRPVRAREGGRLYRLGRFVRRNRLVSALALGLLATLLAGLVTAQWQAREAKREAMRKTAVLEYFQEVLATLVPDSPEAVAEPRSRVLLRAAERAPAALGEEPLVLAQVSETMAGLLARIGEYQAAQAAQERAAALYLGELGAEHPDAVLSHTERMRLFAAQGGISDPEVERALREAVAVTLDRPGYRRQHATALTQLATVLGSLGQAPEALEAVERAQAVLTPADPLQQRVETDLLAAELRIAAGDFDAALDLIQSREQAVREAFGDDHRLFLQLAGLHGEALRNLGRLEAARERLETAVTGLGQLYPEGNERLLDLLGGLGATQYKLGELDPAAETAGRHLDLSRRLLGERSHQTALALSNTGNIEFARGNYARAAELQAESAGIFAELYGEEHVAVALTRGNVAEALHHMGRHEASIELRLSAMPAIAETFGETSSRYLHQLRALARAQIESGRLDDAAASLERVQRQVESAESPSVEEAALNRVWLAELRRRQNRPDEALALLATARDELAGSEVTPAVRESLARIEARLSCHLASLETCERAVETADALYAGRLPAHSPIREELRQLLAVARSADGAG